jgi:hypothetical protein
VGASGPCSQRGHMCGATQATSIVSQEQPVLKPRAIRLGASSYRTPLKCAYTRVVYERRAGWLGIITRVSDDRWGQRTTRTGRPERRITSCAALPRIRLVRSRRPREPIMMMLAS